MEQAILKRFKKAKERRNQNWYSHFEECYDYAIPQRETFSNTAKGSKKNLHLYDDTAQQATAIFANRVQQTVVPSGQQWCKLQASALFDEETMVQFGGAEMTLEEALDMVTDIVFEYIHNSNFDTRVNEALLDLAVSTGALTCELIDGELVFDCVPLAQLYLEAGAKGDITGVWREHKMEVCNIQKAWPQAQLPERYDERKNEEVVIIEGMIEIDDEYQLIVFIESDKEIIYTENFGDNNPWIVFRWAVTPSEVYGRGPLMNVLPSIKTLNAMSKVELQSAELSTLGVWTAVDDGIFNPYTIEIAPAMVIPVSSNSRDNPTLSPLSLGGNIQFHEMAYQKRRDAINRALFANPIGSIDDPTKTATEISIRRQIDLQEAGAAFGRLNNELAGRVFKRVIQLLSDEGIIERLPKIDGKTISVKYTTPLSRQGDIEDADITVRALQMAMSTGIPPEVLMADIKVEDIPSFILDKLGGPSELKRPEAEKEQMKQQAAQAAQMQQQAALEGQ